MIRSLKKKKKLYSSPSNIIEKWLKNTNPVQAFKDCWCLIPEGRGTKPSKLGNAQTIQGFHEDHDTQVTIINNFKIIIIINTKLTVVKLLIKIHLFLVTC